MASQRRKEIQIGSGGQLYAVRGANGRDALGRHIAARARFVRRGSRGCRTALVRRSGRHRAHSVSGRDGREYEPDADKGGDDQLSHGHALHTLSLRRTLRLIGILIAIVAGVLFLLFRKRKCFLCKKPAKGFKCAVCRKILKKYEKDHKCGPLNLKTICSGCNKIEQKCSCFKQHAKSKQGV